MRAIPSLLIAMASAAWIGSAAAQPREDIYVDVSAREIAIESNFTGHRVVVFGAIENYPRHLTPARVYDVVVVLRGPNEPLVAWRKRETAGIWLNRESRLFRHAPGFYAVLSNRPLDQITSGEVLASNAIGFAHLGFGERPPGVTVAREAAFRAALVRLMAREGLYQSHRFGVSFVGGGLFRASVDLPANVPVGDYRADVYLFREGKLIGAAHSDFSIGKEGLERIVTRLASEDPLIYGVIAIMLALGIGLTASVISRG